KVVDKIGLRKCFLTGGTSSCRVHIRKHYALYMVRCKEEGVAEHHWAVPRKLKKARDAEAE
ncbi:hypothetical protein BT96DRAFT_752402, partial [Gymnopus androsaceus JB14]